MKNIITLMAIVIIFTLGSAHAVGLFPVPQTTDVTFNATASYDPVTQRFTYVYDITSGPDNVGDINFISLDITRNGRIFEEPPADFHFSGHLGDRPAAIMMERFRQNSVLPFGTTIETVSTDLPPMWRASPAADGHLMIGSPTGGMHDANGVKVIADHISPSESVSGLSVTALNAPTLRDVAFLPVWKLVLPDEASDTVEMRNAGAQVWSDIIVRQTTIGPRKINYGGGLINQVISDVDKMITLGWIIDIPLITTIQTLITEASAFKSNNDGTAAKVNLQQVIDLMLPVTEAEMRREAIDLLNINIQLVYDHTPDTYIEPDLMLTVEPQDSELEIGRMVFFNPLLIDRARNNQPVVGFDTYTMEILSGPHAGIDVEYATGSELGYRGIHVGTDIVEITRTEVLAFNGPLDEFMVAGLGDPDTAFTVQARVTWTGGSDYVISFFSPPYLDYRGDETIFIHEYTKNIGTTDGAVPTTTRYYLSDVSHFDISTAYELQERIVPPLLVDGQSKSGVTEIIWPTQFPAGRYYFAACADAEGIIAEINENNNCSYHQVDSVAYTIGMMSEDPYTGPPVNIPPFCDDAVASKPTLWPPNHKFKDIRIDGVIDVDQDDILITIIAITQDEAVDSISSGSTSPDGKGVGTPFAQVRAERDGTGDGRVYAIHFKATDTAGNECTGVVNMSSVVHDQGGNSTPAIDSGQVFDSTIIYN